MEGKGFRDLKPEFDAKNAVVCGVSFDTEAENLAFQAKFDLPFSLLCDTGKQLGIAYGAADDDSAGYPKRITVVVDGQGKVHKVFPTVKPSGHAQEVLAAI